MNSTVIENIFKPMIDRWANLDKNKKIKYTVLASAALIIIVTSVMLFARTEYTVLYSNLDTNEAGEIYNKLTSEMNIKAKAQGNGTILVPKQQAEEVRMKLSAEGYPKSGLNYDLFKNSTGFGTTDFEKRKYMQFQLQDRLQNSIKSLDMVEDAIVTIHIPDENTFVLKSDTEKASASVIIRTKNNSELSKDQVKGIEGLITKSVPNLTNDQVFIIDSLGNTLNKSSNDEAELASTQLGLENEVSERYKKQIESMLEPVFGKGNVIAGVRVALDFDKRTTETTTYNPVEGRSDGIPVSIQETKENASGGQEAGVPGQDPNGGAPAYPEINSGTGNYERSEKTVNYEINQIKDMIQKADGNIKDISVSVILNSADIQGNADDQVKEIVAGATGIDPTDVTVQSMPFNSRSGIDDIFDNVRATNEELKRQAYLRNGIIFGVIGLALLAAALYMIKNKRKKEQEMGYEIDKLIPEGMDLVDDYDEIISAKSKKSEKRKFIENYIEKQPEFVTQILRNWLEEDRR